MEFDGNSQPKRKASQMGDGSLSPREQEIPNNINGSSVDGCSSKKIKYNKFYEDKLPPGFRFCPKDEELVGYYLKKKVMNEELACNKIVEVDLYKHTPESLSEKNKRLFGEKELYFFTPREKKYQNGTRPNRAAGDGYWKATGGDKPVMVENVILGYKKALVFYRGKPPLGNKTNWIMHEYRLDNPPPNKSSANNMRLDEWVLCSIYEKLVKESTPIARDEGENEPMHMVEPVGLMPPIVEPGGSMGWENQDKLLDITTNEFVNMINEHNRVVDQEDYIHHPFPNGLVLDIAQVNNVSLSDQIEPMSHNDGTSTAKTVELVGFMPPTESDTLSMPGEIQENTFDLRYLDRILPRDSDCIDASLYLHFNPSSE